MLLSDIFYMANEYGLMDNFVTHRLASCCTIFYAKYSIDIGRDLHGYLRLFYMASKTIEMPVVKVKSCYCIALPLRFIGWQAVAPLIVYAIEQYILHG